MKDILGKMAAVALVMWLVLHAIELVWWLGGKVIDWGWV